MAMALKVLLPMPDLQAQEATSKQAANRVQLGDTSLSVFRNVSFDHLDITRNDGLSLWVWIIILVVS